jgi:hypothetical protein
MARGDILRLLLHPGGEGRLRPVPVAPGFRDEGLALVAELLEPLPLFGGPAPRGGQGLRLLEMDGAVGQPSLDQRDVAEEDEDLGMFAVLGARPLQRGPDQSPLIAQECQLGEQGMRRG